MMRTLFLRTEKLIARNVIVAGMNIHVSEKRRSSSMGSGAYDESQLLAEIAILRKKLAEQDMKLTEIEMKLAEKDKMIREISELTEGVTGVSFKVSVDSEYARVALIHSNSDLVIPTLRHILDKKEMFSTILRTQFPLLCLSKLLLEWAKRSWR